jgi:hypothetical protein
MLFASNLREVDLGQLQSTKTLESINLRYVASLAHTYFRMDWLNAGRPIEVLLIAHRRSKTISRRSGSGARPSRRAELVIGQRFARAPWRSP